MKKGKIVMLWRKIIILWVAVYFIIGFAWVGLEVILYGAHEARVVDDIVGVILTTSITKNIIYHQKKKGEEVDGVKF